MDSPSNVELAAERVAFKKVEAFVNAIFYFGMFAAFLYGITQLVAGWTLWSVCTVVVAIGVFSYCAGCVNSGRGIFRSLTTLEQSWYRRQELETLKEKLRAGETGLFYNGVEMALENDWLIPKKNGRKIF